MIIAAGQILVVFSTSDLLNLNVCRYLCFCMILCGDFTTTTTATTTTSSSSSSNVAR